MRPIFLIGMMACGKSTLGAAVAASGGPAFVDLDAETERMAGASVAGIFATGGENAFAATERRALAEVCGRTDVIVACGGGTPCRADNLELMLGAGTVVWLRADTARIVERIMDAPADQRPLLSDIHGDAAALTERIGGLMSERSPYYRRAHITFDTTHLDTVAEVAAAVADFKALIANHGTPRTP